MRAWAGRRGELGFTLIELLIVVAIIATLAATAVPNFLEAQTRARVARARQDMRSLSVALESYRLDANEYPPPTGNGIPSRLVRLSTPIAYIAHGRIDDPFPTSSGGRAIPHEIEYWGANEVRTALASSADGALLANRLGGGTPRVLWYFLRCSGPDGDINSEGAGYATWRAPEKYVGYLYDPTNGTVSFGDLFRVGGEPAGDFTESARLATAAQ